MMTKLPTFQDKMANGRLGPKMIHLPAGTFTMGDDNSVYDDEKPAHRVHVEEFAISETLVTFDEYDAFCEATGKEKPDDSGWGRGDRPVINVSWHDAQDYVRWLSEQTGEEYRLPAEEEWEYACRAGSNVNKVNNLGEVAWYWENSDAMTHPVGQKKPNAWGLYDMLGNVWEWCQNPYGAYSKD